VEVNPQNDSDKGSTPLHLASEGLWEAQVDENPDIVRLLLDHGPDAQVVRDLSGKTVSEVASGPRSQEIVQLLSQHAVE
jgi:ankyrin repeat protein